MRDTPSSLLSGISQPPDTHLPNPHEATVKKAIVDTKDKENEVSSGQVVVPASRGDSDTSSLTPLDMECNTLISYMVSMGAIMGNHLFRKEAFLVRLREAVLNGVMVLLLK
jgi:hypothetical protein